MGELETLPSSLREKRRYVVFDVLDADVSFGAVVDAVWDTVLALHGERGAAETGLWVMQDLWREEAQRGVIATNKDAVPLVRSALLTVTAIDGTDAVVAVAGVTGTIATAEEDYLGQVSGVEEVVGQD